jgi:aldehyde dehydrogenase (NAD+)
LRRHQEAFGPRLSHEQFGLAGIGVTNQTAKGLDIAKRLRSGWVSVSSSGFMAGLGASAPFGGFKESGIGREGGKWGLMDFSEIQTITW